MGFGYFYPEVCCVGSGYFYPEVCFVGSGYFYLECINYVFFFSALNDILTISVLKIGLIILVHVVIYD